MLRIRPTTKRLMSFTAQQKETLLKLEKNDWFRSQKSIEKQFKFKDFTSAFGFMTRVAIEAEKMNHHPEWKNVYDTVDVILTTHEGDCLGEKDLKLAAIIDDLAGETGLVWD